MVRCGQLYLSKKKKIMWTAMVAIQGQLNTRHLTKLNILSKINSKMLLLAGNLTEPIPSPSYPIYPILHGSCEISSF